MSKFLLPIDGTILITTRYKKSAFQAPSPPERLDLDALDKTDAEKLFDTLSAAYNPRANPEHKKEEKQTLLKKIGGLALEMEQIAVYIGYRSFTTKQLLSKWQRMSRKFKIFMKVTRWLTPYARDCGICILKSCKTYMLITYLVSFLCSAQTWSL